MAEKKMSPMMVHYLETKKQYPDCILFYRLGDFYEMFFDDARTAAEELELSRLRILSWQRAWSGVRS